MKNALAIAAICYVCLACTHGNIAVPANRDSAELKQVLEGHADEILIIQAEMIPDIEQRILYLQEQRMRDVVEIALESVEDGRLQYSEAVLLLEEVLQKQEQRMAQLEDEANAYPARRDEWSLLLRKFFADR